MTTTLQTWKCVRHWLSTAYVIVVDRPGVIVATDAAGLRVQASEKAGSAGTTPEALTLSVDVGPSHRFLFKKSSSAGAGIPDGELLTVNDRLLLRVPLRYGQHTGAHLLKAAAALARAAEGLHPARDASLRRRRAGLSDAA